MRCCWRWAAEVGPKWVKIQNAWDNYVGWISNKQYDTLTAAQFEELNVAHPAMVADIAHVITHQFTKETMAVVMGSVLLISVFFVLINIAVDIIYAWIDPRVRLN